MDLVLILYFYKVVMVSCIFSVVAAVHLLEEVTGLGGSSRLVSGNTARIRVRRLRRGCGQLFARGVLEGELTRTCPSLARVTCMGRVGTGVRRVGRSGVGRCARAFRDGRSGPFTCKFYFAGLFCLFIVNSFVNAVLRAV